MSFLDLVFTRVCIFCAYTRPRYQVSIYRTIGPLVYFFRYCLDFKGLCMYIKL